MIPIIEIDLSKIEITKYPTKTYGLDLVNGKVVDWIDGYDAMVQAIYKQLYTERFMYVIYSEHYGIEIDQYVAKDFPYIQTDSEAVIREALLADDRIQSIEEYTVKQTSLDSLDIQFIVNTVYGILDIHTERRFTL